MKYLKKSEGYVEIPALLINKKSMERQYYLNQVAKYIGMTSLEKKDIQKVEKVIDENIKLDFFKDWICFKSAGSVLFLDKKKWMLNDKSSFESYGFFNFKKFHRLTFLINGAFLYQKVQMCRLKLQKMVKKS